MSFDCTRLHATDGTVINSALTQFLSNHPKDTHSQPKPHIKHWLKTRFNHTYKHTNTFPHSMFVCTERQCAIAIAKRALFTSTINHERSNAIPIDSHSARQFVYNIKNRVDQPHHHHQSIAFVWSLVNKHYCQNTSYPSNFDVKLRAA